MLTPYSPTNCPFSYFSTPLIDAPKIAKCSNCLQKNMSLHLSKYFYTINEKQMKRIK